jgi:hypothetical protein
MRFRNFAAKAKPSNQLKIGYYPAFPSAAQNPLSHNSID